MNIYSYFFHRLKQQLCAFSKFHQFLSAFNDWLAFILILNFVLWLFIYIWLLKFGRRYAKVISGNPFPTKGFVKTLSFLNIILFVTNVLQQIIFKIYYRRNSTVEYFVLFWKPGSCEINLYIKYKSYEIPLDTYIVIYVFKVVVSLIHIFRKAFGKMHFVVGVSE